MTLSHSSVYEELTLSLQKHWKDYRAHLSHCQKRPKKNPVHDLRVSLRRLLAILDFLLEFQPTKTTRQLRKELKFELKLLRQLRDLQYQESDLKTRLRSNDLIEFKKFLKKMKKSEQKRVTSSLNSIRVQRQRQWIQNLSESLLAQSTLPKSEKNANLSLNHLKSQLLKEFERLTIRARAHDPMSIHRSRIALKKLRYTQEGLAPLFQVTNELRHAFKNHQKLLGNIQDAQVLIQLLLNYLVKEKIEKPSPVFMNFLRVVQKNQDTLIETFISRRETFLHAL